MCIILAVLIQIFLLDAAFAQAWRDCVPGSIGPGGCDESGPEEVFQLAPEVVFQSGREEVFQSARRRSIYWSRRWPIDWTKRWPSVRSRPFSWAGSGYVTSLSGIGMVSAEAVYGICL